jgi:hypothetical protein
VGLTGRRRVRWAAAAISIAAGSILLAGCAPLMPVCAGAAVRPPLVELVTQEWHSAHPGGTVHACYDGVCDRADGTTGSFEIVVPQSDADGRKHDLAVTMTDATGTVVTSVSVALVRILGRSGGPCPFPDQWSRAVLVRPDGQLQLGGADDGRIVVPTP